jgi:hypothetical protein
MSEPLPADPRLARCLEEARQRIGLTHLSLAAQAKLSLQTVRSACAWGIASARTLERIAPHLRVDLEDLRRRRKGA